ncbi:hypothetical protein HPT25_07385 [Bacillus sp. BRMEA1]|uniref:hypothetical protein n=1 Tax=Neobacillus endophyticus TaxID=2738405 RepID=UPI001563FD6F|nr:hypothetical protein [Neobacillus endophyticus]NRD77320.1 hypothetical protein [Neobacillus endophyticus]
MINNNQQELSVKKMRQKAILEIIQSGKYEKQEEIVDELVKRGFTTVQGTVSRDIKELKIIKDEDDIYCITTETRQEMHRNELQKLLKENSTNYYKNINFHYMKVEKGKASLYAFHLQEAFPDIILDVTIGVDSLVILINKDAETDEFRNTISNI